VILPHSWDYRYVPPNPARFFFLKKELTTQFYPHILTLKPNHSWAPVAYTCNPSYLRGWDWEDGGSRPAQANSSRDPHLQNNQTKTDWRCGSSRKVSSLQVQSPSSNPSPTKKKKLLPKPGAMAHSYNPSYLESRYPENHIWRSVQGKLARSISTNKLGIVICACNLSYGVKHK
jgi:hypothetical protein